VLTRPRSEFAARLAGLNLVRGTAVPGGLRTADGMEILGAAGTGPAPGDPAVAVFSPSDVAVHLQPPRGSPRNLLPVTISGLEPQGTLVRVRAENGIAADVTTAAVADLALQSGAQVWFVVKATKVAVLAPADHEPTAVPDRSPGQPRSVTTGSPAAS
jgi:molybdate transport system ATP-binding protein